MHNKGITMTALLLTTWALLGWGSQSLAADKSTPKAVELRLAFRDLWVDHIYWVRNVALMTKLGETAAAKVAEEQTLENAQNIANVIIPFYGKEAANNMYGLLVGHYAATKEYMNTVFNDKKEEEAAALKKMNKNAAELSAFLNSANPENWPRGALLSALIAHMGHHMDQINAINAKDFSAEAKNWEAMMKEIYAVADTLAEGIVKQFPQEF